MKIKITKSSNNRSWYDNRIGETFHVRRIDSDCYWVKPNPEDHITQDLGFIPTMEQYLNNMQIQPWMSGTEKRNTAKVKQILID